MIYKLTKKGIFRFTKYNKSQKYIGCLSRQQFIENLDTNHYLIKYLNNQEKFQHNILEKYSNYYFGILNIKFINDINKASIPVGVILSNNLFIVINIDDSSKVIHLFNKIVNDIKTDYTIQHYFSVFINETINHSFEKLEYIENKIINIEKELFKNEIYKNLNPVIFNIKKELILLKRYYEYLNDFMAIIDIYKKENFLNSTIRSLKRLSMQTEYLIQNTVYLREIYQSYLDYYQNRVIKVLTVITAIFLPLTLITSWYGMNLKYMPEINYIYSYPIIILVCVIIIIIFLIIFKKKKII